MNLEEIERLAKVHKSLVEDTERLGASNKQNNTYSDTTNLSNAMKVIAGKITSELDQSKQ